MSKEYLEALMTFNYIMTRCKDEDSYIIKFPLGVGVGTTFGEDMEKAYKVIRQALQRLESIENANPSETLKKLEMLSDCAEAMKEAPSSNWIEYANSETELDYQLWVAYEDLKQYILKAQEQETENAYIEKIKTMMKQKDCALRYIESEDCFAVKTILSDGWYKLTPELVENNIREEIKPLPLIEKNKKLKEENDELKKVLEIIKEKEVRLWQLRISTDLGSYNYHCLEEEELTQEEFELLKRWIG